METKIVHSIGSTAYFVFMLFFLWTSRLPRANPGSGWWAMAMLCAFLARLVYPIVGAYNDAWVLLIAYSLLNIFEKPFLVKGFYRFFKLEKSSRRLWQAAIVIEVLIISFYLLDISIIPARVLFIGFNASVFLYLAILIHQHYKNAHSDVLNATSIICLIFSIHWLSYHPIHYFYSGYSDLGFLVGTALNLMLYLTLLASVLSSFKARLERAESKALKLAYHDPLTGLKNKRYLTTLFDQVVQLTNRPHQLIGIIFIDLDSFKPINDKEGHAVGDKILIQIAKRLEQYTRSTDICVRLGGDEFLIITTQLDNEEQAMSISEKILEQIITPITLDKKTYQLGASVGVSVYPVDGDCVDDLIHKSDVAMYEVKKTGKNKVLRYSKGMG